VPDAHSDVTYVPAKRPNDSHCVSRSMDASRNLRPTLPRETACTGRVMRHANGWFVAFIEEAPSLSACGATPDDAEWNLKLPFAEYVARERRQGRLYGEIRVLWME